MMFKRMIYLVFSIALIFGLVGCGSEEDTSSETTEESDRRQNLDSSSIDDSESANDTEENLDSSTDTQSVEDNTAPDIITTSDNPLETTQGKTAKDNTLKDVSAPFNGVIIVVTTDTIIDTVSTNTIAIHGKVQGHSTDALLKLNANYPNGTKFVVKVYEGITLLGSSKELTYDGSIINFNDIN